MKTRKTVISTALAAAAFVFGNSAQAGIIIDLFTDAPGGQLVTTQTNGATVFSTQGDFPLTIVGGWRDLSITKTGDVVGNVNVGAASLEVDGGGVLSLSNASGVSSEGVVTWDGSNNAGAGGTSVNITGLGGKDFTASGEANSFVVDVFSADLGFQYDIRVWDMDGSEATLSAGAQFVPSGVYPSYYQFDWFQLSNGTYCDGVSAPPACVDPFTQLDFVITRGGNLGDIDFEHIGALQLLLHGTADADFAIGQTGTVPEPGSMALLGLGLLGMSALRRRK